MESDRCKRFEGFWLLVPWLAVIAVIVVEKLGLKTWFKSALPASMSGFVQWDLGWEIAGVALVTYLSSARWTYLFLNHSAKGFHSKAEVTTVALLVSAAQMYAMAMVYFLVRNVVL